MFVHDSATNISFDTFRERSSGRKVVLLYPWTNYRDLFLASFLNDPKDGMLYYRVSHEQTNLTNWLTGLIESFDQALGGFGSHLRQALAEPKAALLGEALARDLNALDMRPLILFIDELDRTPQDSDFNKFATALVNNLADDVQLAISSRMMTYRPWHDMLADSIAVVLGTEYRRNDMSFVVEEHPKPQVEVHAFGRGQVLVNGNPITNWDGALPRNLFFFFLDNPLITRDQIFETFWPDLSVKEATNVFHVTKRKITERISMKVLEGGNYELTQYNTGFYMPSDKVVRHYDVGDFEDAIERSMTVDDERQELALLMRAVDLYRQPFLNSIEMKWVQKRREQLRLLYGQALIGLGRIYRKRGDEQTALQHFLQALKETPEREDIHRDVMSIYVNLNMIDEARQQYRELEQMLKDTLNIAPARETRDLYAMINGDA